jgi:hypothetical protein
MKLTPQEQQIINLLSDYTWHCGNEINALYIKDDRKRISDLTKKKGFRIESRRCAIKDHNHVSPILMRRLTEEPTDSENLKWMREELANRMEMKKPIETLNGQLSLI